MEPEEEVRQFNDQIKQQAHAEKIKEFRGQRLNYTDHGRQQGSSSAGNQAQHAQEVRENRHERDVRRKNPVGAKLFDALMKFAQDAKPSWHGRQSSAERHSFAHPHNIPKVVPPTEKPKHDKAKATKSGQEGGAITFVACVDNGDSTYSTKKITAVATSFAYP